LLLSFAAFLLYVASVIVIVFVLVFYFSPLYGQSNVLIYTAICSLMGSLSVMALLPAVHMFSIVLLGYILIYSG